MGKHSLIAEHVDKFKDYYHSEVEVLDYPFSNVVANGYDPKKLDVLIARFNGAETIEAKNKLADQLPQELFPTCRFCGKRIVNINFELKLIHGNIIKVLKPAVHTRVVDGVKHVLSCCEDCLLEHFKNDPPKSPKYYFMKGNKYGAYSFDLSEAEYKTICSMTAGVTEQSLIRKHGEEKGKQMWEDYRKKQAEKNTFEYKQKNLGWTKEQFDEFNKSRAITLKNMIKKYGKEEGKKKYEEYVEKQQITKSWDYMTQVHGEDKAKQINSHKSLSKDNFIRKYGEAEGLRLWKECWAGRSFGYSEVSQELFRQIDALIGDKHETYFATKNREYEISLNDGRCFMLDYFIKDLSIAIEFNGKLFHADPRFYKADDVINPFNSNNPLTAKQIWDKDKERYDTLKKLGISTIVVWETDYRSPEFNVTEFMKFHNLL